MRKNIFYTLALGLIVASCGSESTEVSDAEKAAAAAAASTSYVVNAAESNLTWKGEMMGMYTHNGTVSLAGGAFTMEAGNITSGEFMIDMKTIAPLDANFSEEKPKENLIGHLMSPDFFNVDSFPTINFVVTGAEMTDANPGATHNVSGNLTIKGITANITIPANVTVTGDNISVSVTDFVINRADWKVKYGSAKFFDNLGDYVISDNITLGMSLKAAKQ